MVSTTKIQQEQKQEHFGTWKVYEPRNVQVDVSQGAGRNPPNWNKLEALVPGGRRIPTVAFREGRNVSGYWQGETSSFKFDLDLVDRRRGLVPPCLSILDLNGMFESGEDKSPLSETCRGHL